MNLSQGAQINTACKLSCRENVDVQVRSARLKLKNENVRNVCDRCIVGFLERWTNAGYITETPETSDMNHFDSSKDYYSVLGADECINEKEIERLYKRQARRCHPDSGGSEEAMKALNEAYGVLGNVNVRRAYDAERTRPAAEPFIPVASPAAQADAISGQAVGAVMAIALGIGLFLLVRSQWIWFLWPLEILAAFLGFFGILMCRATLIALRNTVGAGHPARRHTNLQEALFWTLVCGGIVSLYFLIRSL